MFDLTKPLSFMPKMYYDKCLRFIYPFLSYWELAKICM